MNAETKDINDLVVFLSGTGMGPLLNNAIWQCYGYKRRPKRGGIWYEVFPKIFELENFISRELLMMGMIDVMNGIKKSTIFRDTKLLIAIGVVDQFLSTTRNIFSGEEFMSIFFNTYTANLKEDGPNYLEPITRAKNVLNKKNFARFLVGTTNLKVNYPHDNRNFFLKNEYILNAIEKFSKAGTLRVSMSDEAQRKYLQLLEEKVFNS